MNFNNIIVKFDNNNDILYVDIYENLCLYKYSKNGLKYKIYELMGDMDIIDFIYYNRRNFEKGLINALKDLTDDHFKYIKNGYKLVYEINTKKHKKILKLVSDIQV